MVFRDETYRVLLVSAAEKFNTVTCSLLPGAEFYPVEIVKTAKAAQRRLLEQEFDLILVNTPLPDEFGTELAMDACLRSRAGVLLLVKRELHDEICAKVTDAGVLTLPKPTSEAVMRHMLRKMGPHLRPSDDGGGSPSVHSAPVHGSAYLQAHSSRGDPPDPAELAHTEKGRQDSDSPFSYSFFQSLIRMASLVPNNSQPVR